MPLVPSAKRRRWRKKWDPFLTGVFIVVFVLLSPIIILWAIVWGDKYEKEKRRIANRTPCDICGALLGEGALKKSNARLCRGEALSSEGYPVRSHPPRPRHDHAICVECGARYDYHEDSKYIKYFKRIPDSTGPSLL